MCWAHLARKPFPLAHFLQVVLSSSGLHIIQPRLLLVGAWIVSQMADSHPIYYFWRKGEDLTAVHLQLPDIRSDNLIHVGDMHGVVNREILRFPARGCWGFAVASALFQPNHHPNRPSTTASMVLLSVVEVIDAQFEGAVIALYSASSRASEGGGNSVEGGAIIRTIRTCRGA